MNIIVIGAGYVGLVSGACFAEFGFNVLCIDKNKDKIKNLNDKKIPIYEPGLDELVEKNILAKRLLFSEKLPSDLKDTDAVFIAVDTPSISGTDRVQLTNVFEAVKEVASNINKKDKPLLIVTKSTVPVGTAKKNWRNYKIT